ncbi:MAG: YlqD family protein [Candidatus Muiribacteriaceae bacterium]
MGLSINRKVVVRSIVTPELLEELGKQISEGRQNLGNSINILNEKMTSTKDITVQSQIRNEVNRLSMQLQEIDRKAAEIERLEMGEEFYQGTVEAPVEIELGDNLFEKMSKSEIIVNNGEVVEFRNL